MEINSYGFKLGDYNCWIINDGKCSGPDKLEAHSDRNNINELDTSVLLVRTKSNVVLFDTGWGIGAKAAPLAGLLTKNLEATGINRGEIDTIIFSHGHPDHIGGNTDTKGNLVFPNARYYIFRKEWEFWTSESDFSSMPENIRQNVQSAVQKNLFPLRNKINLVDCTNDIIPGISCMATPGHTPGHIVLIVTSGHRRLLCCFDAFHNPTEVEMPSTFLTPPMTGEAEVSRVKILSRIRPDDLIYAGHFPFPGLGHIIRKKNIYYWHPIATTFAGNIQKNIN